MVRRTIFHEVIVYFAGLKILNTLFMSRFTSTNYSEGAFNFATLATRLTFGFIIFWHHGVAKLKNFSALQYTFPNPIHLGSRVSLCLVIFAEVFCSVLVVLGFLTRLALIPLVITLGVALAIVHRGQGIMNAELAWLYFAVFFSLLLTGPGRISVDGLIR
jgi:putative oxidoreductase